MNQNYSLSDLKTISEKIIFNSNTKIILFFGEMGVGKTTLIKQICKDLNVIDAISSPTFSLVNEYKTLNGDKVFHFDFYRLLEEEEALDIGIYDYFESNEWCLVEWPENIENLLPLNFVRINLKLLENGQRNIQLKNK